MTTRSTDEAMAVLNKYRRYLIEKGRYEAYLIAEAFGEVHSRLVRARLESLGLLGGKFRRSEFWLGAVFNQCELFTKTGRRYQYSDDTRNIHEREVHIWCLRDDAQPPSDPGIPVWISSFVGDDIEDADDDDEDADDEMSDLDADAAEFESDADDDATAPSDAPAPDATTNTAVKRNPDPEAPLHLDLKEARYNARDVLGMCRVYKFLVDAVQRTDTSQVYLIDREMATLALQMTRAGMPVDETERKRVGDHLRQIRDAAVAELQKYTEDAAREDFIKWAAQFMAAKPRKDEPAEGMMDPDTGLTYSAETAYLKRTEKRREEFAKKLAKKGVNFGAKVQQAAIMRVAGVPLLKMTEKQGLPKINKETLEEQGHHPAARAMLEYTLTSAALRTFIDGLEVGPDGRLHPSWAIHKITGRWGSSPNVQNWSKRAGGGVENLRRMIAAPEGFTFVGADQKQLEARLIAACSQDPFLLDVFRRNADIHGELAGVAFADIWPELASTYAKHKGQNCGVSADQPKCPVCKQRDKIRDLTKRLEYGAFYGGSADTLWSSCVKDFPDLKPIAIQQFLATVGKRMNGVIKWREQVLRDAIDRGEIRSPILGRREVFPLHHMGRVEPTVAYNFIPQSGGADLWALGAVEFCKLWDQTTDSARLIHNGHDSVLILCRNEHAAQVETDVHTCWEREWNGVQFLMDCKQGQRWSEV